MLEKHPFPDFVPPRARYLILGSFVAKKVDGYDWFYGSKRNQFWPILEAVYSKKLKSKNSQQALFLRLGIAITDIILECERLEGSSLDVNLKNLVLNTRGITNILKTQKIGKTFFTSRFVENLFKRNFKDLLERHSQVEFITLPSPSPRYAAMRIEEKIERYKSLLPNLP